MDFKRNREPTEAFLTCRLPNVHTAYYHHRLACKTDIFTNSDTNHPCCNAPCYPASQVFGDVVRLLIFNNLTVGIHQQRIFNDNNRRFPPLFRLSLRNIPQTQMIQNLADHRHFLDKRQHPHRAAAVGTGERINLVNLLNQPCPVGTTLLAIRRICFLPGNFRYLCIDQPKPLTALL